MILLSVYVKSTEFSACLFRATDGRYATSENLVVFILGINFGRASFQPFPQGIGISFDRFSLRKWEKVELLLELSLSAQLLGTVDNFRARAV